MTVDSWSPARRAARRIASHTNGWVCPLDADSASRMCIGPPPRSKSASTADFDRLVASASIPIVVDFWAPWCGPCRMVAPELAKVAARAAGRFLVVKVNTDVLNDLGQRLKIRSIPTMAVFSGGREAARTAGARPASDIEAFVNQAIQVPR